MTTNGERVHALYEAFGRGDVPAVVGAFDPQIRWQEAESFRYADRNPYVGPQAVAEGVFLRISSDVLDFAVVPERIADAGETVLAEGRYRGTVKATGRTVNVQFAHVWRFRDGRVIGFQQYTDTKQWADAFGA
ncbi:MAG: nuclear transport factor 2 family protein [Vicinamibacterales bacterium]